MVEDELVLHGSQRHLDAVGDGQQASWVTDPQESGGLRTGDQ
jgi:hypothetical protein